MENDFKKGAIMVYTIENESLMVGIDSKGAALTNLLDKESNRELLYQVDPQVWTSQDIAIFPVIDHRPYSIDGKEYLCPLKHGIIRGMDADDIVKTNDRLALRFDSNAETLKQFPFEFSFHASFAVEGRTIRVVYTVENKSDKPMPFYVGGHPGLYAKDGTADVVFETRENPEIWLLYEGFVVGHRPFGETDSIHVSKKSLSEHKTFILSGIKSNNYLMKTKDVNYRINTNAPVVGLWSKPFGGSYVCFEPWWGMAVQKDDYRELSDKEFVNILDEGARESFEYSIEPMVL